MSNYTLAQIKKDAPDGFSLVQAFTHQGSRIRDIKWSPDGRLIASTSDSTWDVYVWEPLSGEVEKKLPGHKNAIYCVDWSPTGKYLATGSADKSICIWDVQNGRLLNKLVGHKDLVTSVAWAPNEKFVISASDDLSIRVWEWPSGHQVNILNKHKYSGILLAWASHGDILASGSDDGDIIFWDGITFNEKLLISTNSGIDSISWSGDSKILATGHHDSTIRLWDSISGRQLNIFEGHTAVVRGIRFSSDNKFLISQSFDNTIRLWRIETGELVSILQSPNNGILGGLAFHPASPLLATKDSTYGAILIWSLDYEKILATTAFADTRQYTNAKIVLLGDSGVGKSGLALVLTGKEFTPTESTHGRHVWTFEEQEINHPNGIIENRETLLWDLAGQPGYRIIHQLHLNEVALALVVFDSRSEIEPFSGVGHWDKALLQARRIFGDQGIPTKKFLIAARSDRGGLAISNQRIQAMIKDRGFDGFFETSAKEGWQIPELIKAIKDGVPWETLPKVSSNTLFITIKNFLVKKKLEGLILLRSGDLFTLFCEEHADISNDKDLSAKFNTCIGRVESRGLIKRLSFGDFILMQPELIDAYGSAFVIAAKDEPDGLGFISEEEALAGRIRMSDDERIKNKELEKVLIIATIEELIRNEIALKEYSVAGADLVFPSQFTRERPDAPFIHGKSVLYNFQGPIQSIYSTLAVRLSRSNIFTRKEMWKNVAIYESLENNKQKSTCGMILREVGEGNGELSIFFDNYASQKTRYQFEEFISYHLMRRSLSGSVVRGPVINCDNCGSTMQDDHVKMRLNRGMTTMNCPVCDTEVSLIDRDIVALQFIEQDVSRMDSSANFKRERETTDMIIRGKQETNDFDVFICYNSEDRDEVSEIAKNLKGQGILPWMDIWNLRPGIPWHKEMEKYISNIKSAAVFVGQKGTGPWQDREIDVLLHEFIQREIPIIPVFLSRAPKKTEIPLFLKGMTWVDFRTSKVDLQSSKYNSRFSKRHNALNSIADDSSNPYAQLVWGITGNKNQL